MKTCEAYSAIINAIHERYGYLSVAGNVVSDIIGSRVEAFEVPYYNEDVILVCFLDKSNKNSLTVAIRADGGVEYFIEKWYDKCHSEMQEVTKDKFIHAITERDNTPKKIKAVKYMLDNAGEIQHYANILFDDENNYIIKESDGWTLWYYYEGYGMMDMAIPEKIAKFFIKGRTLRSGLASPMARRLAWRALGYQKGTRVSRSKAAFAFRG